jgi:predicted DNA-binding WGR domain protein
MSRHIVQPAATGPLDLTRVEPAADRFRFYRLMLQPDLFGGCTLVREWGRCGQPGTVRVRTLATDVEAARLLAGELAQRRRRGYRAPAHGGRAGRGAEDAECPR